MPEQSETVGNLILKKKVQEFDATKMYLHHKSRSVSFRKRGKCSVFIIFELSHDTLFKMSTVFKYAGKKCAVFV